MMHTIRNISLIFFCIGFATAAVADDDCPYMPEFKKLRANLGSMQPAEAVRDLEQYSERSQSTDVCERIEINALLNEREKSFFFLQVGPNRLPAQLVMRCNEFDPKTTTCQGPLEDHTLHNDPRIPPLAIPTTNFKVVSTFPAAGLVGIYRRFNGDVLDGKAAMPLKPENGHVSLPKATKNFVLIAIYKTHGPWSYRKVVWYF